MTVSGCLAFVLVGFERFEQSMKIKIFFGLVTGEKSLLGWTPYFFDRSRARSVVFHVSR